MRNKKDLIILIAALAFFAVIFIFLRPGFTSLFGGQMTAQSPAFFSFATIASLVDSTNPCAFSVLLLTIAFLFNLKKSRGFILMIGALYIFGIFLVYFLIGLGVFHALTIFGIPNFVSHIGAAILVLIGLVSLAGHFFADFPIHFKLPESAHPRIAKFIGRASIPSAIFLGAFVGIFEFPCTGGPYLLILGLLHDTATYGKGIAYLFWYNFVFVFPLLVTLFIASNPILLGKAQEWRKKNVGEAKLISGIAMIILGFIIFLF